MSSASNLESTTQVTGIRSPDPNTFSGRAVKRFNQVLDDTALTLFILLLAVASLQVLSRYVLVAPLPWTEEVARFLLVWVTFLGAASVTRRKLHIAVEFLSAKFPLQLGTAVSAAQYLLMIIFLAVVLWGTVVMFMSSWPVHAGTLPWLSMSWVYLGAVLGVFIMLVVTICHFWSTLLVMRRFSARDKE
jgi:TRAP-type C4-dicarboxylate transport system permease small subunit